MTRIAPVNLSNNPRTLWFDARDLDIAEGSAVVVLTARGLEFGHTAGEVFEASEEQVANLKSPLKPVKRVATPEDEAAAIEMEQKSRDALPVFKELAAEMSDIMRPVSVEFLLDGDKAIFYFEAEDRIDFRDLVRKLAAHFHVRVDMRQIGVRDEARLIGGLGHCGQELCCKRLGGEFCPVSIRMAKEQDLSLNPQKISGVCGRLMCCLRYEYDTYKDFNKRAPKRNACIQTPEGCCKVCELDVPREVVTVRTEDGKALKVPLADFEPVQGEGRPSEIGEAAWERAVDRSRATFSSAVSSLFTNQLTAEDTLADPKAVRRTGSAAQDTTDASAHSGQASAQQKAGKNARSKGRAATKEAKGRDNANKKREPVGRKARSSAAANDAQAAVGASSSRTPRRRRSMKLDTQASQAAPQEEAKATAGARANSGVRTVKPANANKVAGANGAQPAAGAQGAARSAAGAQGAGKAKPKQGVKVNKRSKRSQGSQQGGQQGGPQGNQQGGLVNANKAAKRNGAQNQAAQQAQPAERTAQAKQDMRPGRGSSGVRTAYNGVQNNGSAANATTEPAAHPASQNGAQKQANKGSQGAHAGGRNRRRRNRRVATGGANAGTQEQGGQ